MRATLSPPLHYTLHLCNDYTQPASLAEHEDLCLCQTLARVLLTLWGGREATDGFRPHTEHSFHTSRFFKIGHTNTTTDFIIVFK